LHTVSLQPESPNVAATKPVVAAVALGAKRPAMERTLRASVGLAFVRAPVEPRMEKMRVGVETRKARRKTMVRRFWRRERARGGG
jgi:hypothetical protein